MNQSCGKPEHSPLGCADCVRERLDEALGWKHLMTVQLATSERERNTLNLQKDSLQKAYDALFAAANRVYHKCGFDKDWTEWKDLMDCLSSPLPSADLKPKQETQGSREREDGLHDNLC